MPARRWTMRGRVQGVGFRWYARREAKALALDGWVENRADGSVVAVAAGEEVALDRFERALRQGPVSARVDSIRGEPSRLEPESGFEVRFS